METQEKVLNLVYDVWDEENNKPIAIYLPKSIQSLIANIAITFSANIYMHLDIKNPSERILNILNLIQPRIIITNSLYLKELVKLPSNIIIINIDEINFDEWNFTKDQLEKYKINKK